MEIKKFSAVLCLASCEEKVKVDQRDEPVNKCIDAHSCKCNVHGYRRNPGRASNTAKGYKVNN